MVANHPWTALGAAAAVGYLIVPHRRSRRTSGDEHLAAALAAAARGPAAVQLAEPPAPRTSIARSVFSILTPVVVLAAQNYVLGQVEQWLAANAFLVKANAEAGHGEPDQPPSSDQDVAGQTIRFRDRR